MNYIKEHKQYIDYIGKYIDSDGSELDMYFHKLYNATLYLKNGLFHRLDGPAIEYPNGNYSWYKNNRRHRIGGPAIDYPDIKIWYTDNKFLEIYYICG